MHAHTDTAHNPRLVHNRVFMALPRSVQEFLTMAVPILGVKRDAIKTIQCDSLGK